MSKTRVGFHYRWCRWQRDGGSTEDKNAFTHEGWLGSASELTIGGESGSTGTLLYMRFSYQFSANLPPVSQTREIHYENLCHEMHR